MGGSLGQQGRRITQAGRDDVVISLMGNGSLMSGGMA
jgi:hypothetical protein